MYRNNFLSGILAPSKTRNIEDEEFDGPVLHSKWTESGTATLKSLDDRIRSAYYYKIVSGDTSGNIKQDYANAGNFSITLCGSVHKSQNFHNMALYVLGGSGGSQNGVGVQVIYNSGHTIRTVKYVAGVFSQVDSTTIGEFDYPIFLLHIQRSGNNWDLYYSNNGISWTKFATTIALTFTVDRFQAQWGLSGATATMQVALHWIRRDWITL